MLHSKYSYRGIDYNDVDLCDLKLSVEPLYDQLVSVKCRLKTASKVLPEHNPVKFQSRDELKKTEMLVNRTAPRKVFAK